MDARRHPDLTAAFEGFQSQAEYRTSPRSTGEKLFLRWAWWMTERGGHHGSPKPSSWWYAASQWKNKNLSLATMPIGNEWTYVGPDSIPVHGGAGRINKIQIDPNDASHWFACAPSGGLWHSSDEGGHWNVFGVDALEPLGASDVWIDPSNSDHVWLATGDGNGGDTYSIGILETVDGGSTWSPLELEFGVEQGRKVRAIAPHVSQDETFLVATDLGVFKTTNAGISFSLVKPGNTRDVVWMNDSTAVAAIENIGISVTTDAGNSWIEPSLPESTNSIGRIQLAAESMDADNTRDTLYAIAGHYFQQNFLAVWMSVDAGQTWSVQCTRLTGPNLLGYTLTGADNGGQAFWDLCIEVDPIDASHVLVCGVNVWESHDFGVNWTCPIHWQGALDAKYAHADQHDILFLPNGDVLLANDGGVYRWSGEQVQDLSNDLHIAQGYAIGHHPTLPDTWLLGTQDNGTNLSSPESCSRILDGDGFHAFFDASIPGRLYASAYYGLLYRSDDGGRTLQNIANYFQSSGPNELGAWQTPFQLHPAMDGRIVAAKKSLHFSDDGGDTWTTRGGMGTVRSTALALSDIDVDVAMVSKNAQLYWKSSASTSFQPVTALPGEHIGDVAIVSGTTENWWVGFGSYLDSTQVWYTSDAGQSWENRSGGLPSLPVHKLIEMSDGTWLCATELGVHAWNDDVMLWEPFGTGLPLTPVVDLAIDSTLNRLVASTFGRGVWSAPVPNLPEWDAEVVRLNSPRSQCMLTLVGEPEVQITGSEAFENLSYIVSATSNNTVITDTINTDFDVPLEFSNRMLLPPFCIEVPSSGAWNVTIELIQDGLAFQSTPFETTLIASGLGHTMTLEWWGDCENMDMRWELRDESNDEIVLLSTALASGDTTLQEWCLSEGCYSLIWDDKGEDGFSGADCGEGGGYVMRGPFGEVWDEANAVDFGSQLLNSFCIDVPWCFADYNGDGTRSVTDLLSLLGDFGCTTSCETDNNLDGSVGVSDLMNVLSVFGTGCDPDP